MDIDSGAKKRPRISILGPLPPSSGGVATNIQNLLKSPLSRKYSLLPYATGSSAYGTSAYFGEGKISKLYASVKSFINYYSFIIKCPPDIVHINTSFRRYAFWRDAVYMLISKLFRKTVLLQIHGGRLDEFYKHYRFPVTYLIHKILQLPARIIVLSKAQCECFDNLENKCKIEVIPNMIVAAKFNRSLKTKALNRSVRNIISVLFVAPHFFKEKGVWDILRVIPSVVKCHKRVSFVLVGSGGEDQAMKKYCKEEKLEDYVIFKGYIKNEDIVNLYLYSDIFILPSYSEGFPLVILEAMAAGLPIISTSVGAIPEIVADGKNGFIIQPGVLQPLAESIIQLVKDKSLRDTMGAYNRKIVRERYDMKKVSKSFDEIYSMLISERE